MNNIERKVEKIYYYLKDKYKKDKDDYHLHLLTRQKVREHLERGATSIDYVQIRNDGSFDDAYDRMYQMEWEDSWRR